ncbi:MAG: S-methyl-5-thioribose-1-phosphate isomerase [Spirochaetes bacterium]|nr:MAG: S-methyl-5-thioribose-1-phosphate isomerase [Spirochaetota bacterium]
MEVDGKHYRTIWVKEDDKTTVQVIDQSKLPHLFEIIDLHRIDDFIQVIKEMNIRGAGLIGAAAGYGMYIAALNAPEREFDSYINECAERLIRTRPTAKNLEWAVNRQLKAIFGEPSASRTEKIQKALLTASSIADEDVESCKMIGEHGVSLIEELSRKKGAKPVNILTHCNAGWLAFVDYGSATAPIYAAHKRGIEVHVWVDETRPRNQGASLTAWELGKQGVPHHLIADNTGGHLMQHSLVDIVIVGSDRTGANGDVANKIGTYLKALAAKDNGIPFYVALPSSSFDWKISDGIGQIPIEERDAREVKYVKGLVDGKIKEVLICPEETDAVNYGFDVTPARLVTGLITERGICRPEREDILRLFPEKR